MPDDLELRRAESLYVDFLRRGPGAELASFCDEHPAHARALREIHAQHRAALERLSAAGLRPQSASTPVLPASTPASSELLARIAAHGARGARYEVRGELGRGGMGVVLRAWDGELGRELAMKVVQRETPNAAAAQANRARSEEQAPIPRT